MVKHAPKIAGVLVGLVLSMFAYWAHATDGRLNSLEKALLTLARIEAKVDYIAQEIHKERK